MVRVVAGHHDILSYCQPSSVANYRGLTMSVDMTHCRNPYCNERWKVVAADEDLGNHWSTTSRNGQANHCRCCCALQTTEPDGQPSQQRRLSKYPQRRPSVTGIVFEFALWQASCTSLCAVRHEVRTAPHVQCLHTPNVVSLCHDFQVEQCSVSLVPTNLLVSCWSCRSHRLASELADNNDLHKNPRCGC